MTEEEVKNEQQEFTISPDLNAKMKKNLLWIFMFAAIMIFAGLTSGYIVSQGGKFWVNVKMPSAFLTSTILIVASSLCLVGATWAVKNEKQGVVKTLLGLAFAFGAIFGYTQLKGWGQLMDTGNTVSASIINVNGKYGKYYTLFYQDKEITYDNAKFYLKGDLVSADVMEAMKTLSTELMVGSKTKEKTYNLSNYGTDFVLRYDNTLVTYLNNGLQLNGVPLSSTQHSRLFYFSDNIVNDRGDFMMKGEYGKDFSIFYKGAELEYTNRTFYLDGKLLSPKKMNDLTTQDNTASSYIYAFTFMHLLHWIGGVIALLVMFIRGVEYQIHCLELFGDYFRVNLLALFGHIVALFICFFNIYSLNLHKENFDYGRSSDSRNR